MIIFRAKIPAKNFISEMLFKLILDGIQNQRILIKFPIQYNFLFRFGIYIFYTIFLIISFDTNTSCC